MMTETFLYMVEVELEKPYEILFTRKKGRERDRESRKKRNCSSREENS